MHNEKDSQKFKKRHNFFYLDIETTGLNVYKDKIITIQFFPIEEAINEK